MNLWLEIYKAQGTAKSKTQSLASVWQHNGVVAALLSSFGFYALKPFIINYIDSINQYFDFNVVTTSMSVT